MAADHFGEARELALASAPPERQVYDEKRQRRFAETEAHAKRAATRDHPGEPHFGDFIRMKTAEQAKAVLAEMPEVAVSLIVPIRKIAACRELSETTLII